MVNRHCSSKTHRLVPHLNPTEPPRWRLAPKIPGHPMQTRSSTTNTHWYRHIRALYSNNRQHMSTGHSNTTGPNHVFKAKTNELSTGNEVEEGTAQAPRNSQCQCILPQSTSAQRPTLVFQLFKRAVDGSLESPISRYPRSLQCKWGTGMCLSLYHVLIKCMFSLFKTTPQAFCFINYFFAGEGGVCTAAERSRSETTVVSNRHNNC
jgi:hypothetical protein